MELPTAILPVAAAWLLWINIWAFLRFGADKERARRRQRRIAERDLLRLALFGGTAGAFLGRHIFRHKTCKQPFTTHLQVIAGVQLGALVCWWVISTPMS